GKRRQLEIAIALACEPRVLLLDEPVAGVPASERGELLDIINALPKDMSILLIEHDMDLVFSFAQRITVLVNGSLLLEADPQDRKTQTTGNCHCPGLLAACIAVGRAGGGGPRFRAWRTPGHHQCPAQGHVHIADRA